MRKRRAKAFRQAYPAQPNTSNAYNGGPYGQGGGVPLQQHQPSYEQQPAFQEAPPCTSSRPPTPTRATFRPLTHSIAQTPTTARTPRDTRPTTTHPRANPRPTTLLLPLLPPPRATRTPTPLPPVPLPRRTTRRTCRTSRSERLWKGCISEGSRGWGRLDRQEVCSRTSAWRWTCTPPAAFSPLNSPAAVNAAFILVGPVDGHFLG